MIFIHCIRILSSVTMPTLEKCCYTRRDTRLHTLISYSDFEVPCSDRNLKSALDHTARDK